MVETIVQPRHLIWILEDDPQLQFVYEDILSTRYRLRMFPTLEELYKAVGLGDQTAVSEESLVPSLLIADLRLSDGQFLDVLRNQKVREALKCPFIVVSSIDDIDVLRFCFANGAVDYLVKPFKKTELIAKTERLIGQFEREARKSKVPPSVLQKLTLKEQRILHLFLDNPGTHFSREEVLHRIWGGVTVDPKTVDVHLSNLRKKIADTGLKIVYAEPDGWRLNDRV